MFLSEEYLYEQQEGNLIKKAKILVLFVCAVH